MASKTVRRDWLKRQVEAGNIEAKCNYSLTDDYAFDNATGFGKTGWIPARIRNPKFGMVLVNNFKMERCIDSDHVQGQMNFNPSDFKGKSGWAYRNVETGIISFGIHSNASYDLRIKA